MRNDRSIGDPPPLRFMSPTIAARLLGRLSVDILCPSTETETSDIVMQSRECVAGTLNGRSVEQVASVASAL